MGVGQPLAQTSGMPGVPFHKAKKHGSKKRSHRGRKRGK